MRRTPLRRKTPLRPGTKQLVGERARRAESLLAEIHNQGLTELLAERVKAHVEAVQPKRRYRRRSPEVQLKDQLWDLCRKIVLLRDRLECRKCGARQSTRKVGDYGRPLTLHVHHIRSQGAHPALRYELENLITLCAKCHMPFGRESAHSSDPAPFQEWLKSHVGQEHLDRLDLLAQVRKGQRTDLQAIHIYLSQQLALVMDPGKIGKKLGGGSG